MLIKNSKKLLKKIIFFFKNPNKEYQYKFNTDDLFIVEFPKSGITYFSFLWSTLLANKYKLPVKPTFYNLGMFVIDIHQSKYMNCKTILPHRIFKSHLKYQLEYKSVVYLIRNPVDVMVSYYNFIVDMSNSTFNLSFSQFIRSSNFGIPAYINHIEDWLTDRKYSKVLVIRYEDITHHPRETILRLQDMMGYAFSEEEIEKAVVA